MKPIHPAYTLDDVEIRHQAHPDTFAILTRQERENLRPGALAKLIFEAPVGGERMWVQITERLPNGRYRGTLDNDPIVVDLCAGDVVDFGPEHIADIYECDNDPRPRLRLAA